MFARLDALPRDQERYGFEVKWDGIRAIGYWEPGRWRLASRNLHDITATWPELRAIGRQLGSRSVVLDGEIVAFNEQGRPSFERLQPRMHLTGDATGLLFSPEQALARVSEHGDLFTPVLTCVQ